MECDNNQVWVPQALIGEVAFWEAVVPDVVWVLWNIDLLRFGWHFRPKSREDKPIL